jgi:hypothetical protein
MDVSLATPARQCVMSASAKICWRMILEMQKFQIAAVTRNKAGKRRFVFPCMADLNFRVGN